MNAIPSSVAIRCLTPVTFRARASLKPTSSLPFRSPTDDMTTGRQR